MEKIAGRCPMGCGNTLFLGEGGHVTCSFDECPEPAAADALLKEPPVPIHVPLDDAAERFDWTVKVTVKRSGSAPGIGARDLTFDGHVWAPPGETTTGSFGIAAAGRALQHAASQVVVDGEVWGLVPKAGLRLAEALGEEGGADGEHAQHFAEALRVSEEEKVGLRERNVRLEDLVRTFLSAMLGGDFPPPWWWTATKALDSLDQLVNPRATKEPPR